MKTHSDSKTYSIRPLQKKVSKPWGYEIIFSPEDTPYTGKILHINKAHRLSLQYHDKKRETLCLIIGEAILELSDRQGKIHKIKMKKNKGYTIEIGQRHRIEAITDCYIVEASQQEVGNTIRLEDDYGRPTETEEMRRQNNRGWGGK